jgi:hypothetical protein
MARFELASRAHHGPPREGSYPVTVVPANLLFSASSEPSRCHLRGHVWARRPAQGTKSKVSNVPNSYPKHGAIRGRDTAHPATPCLRKSMQPVSLKIANLLVSAHRLLRWPQQRHGQPLMWPRSSWCWRTTPSRRSSCADRLCALRGAFWCSNDWFELCSACAGRASPDCISLLVRRPRARHPRHYTLTQ